MYSLDCEDRYTDRTVTPPNTLDDMTNRAMDTYITRSENTDVVANTLFLVLRNALRNPSDVADFLRFCISTG
jgi:hypothetical protein